MPAAARTVVGDGTRGLPRASLLPRLALVVAGLVAVLVGVFPAILALARQLALGSFTPLAIFVPFAAVGFLLARRRPGNPIGWLLLAGVGAGIVGTDAGYYAWAIYGVGHRGLPLGPVAVVLGESWQVVLLAAWPLVILLFPDGVPRSRALKRVVVAFVGFAVVAFGCALALGVNAVIGGHLNAQTVNNGPGGGLLLNQPANTQWLRLVGSAFDAAFGLLLLAAVVYQLASYRRADGMRRQQLKCMMGGALVCVLALVALPFANPGSSLISQIWSQIPWIALCALPISIGIAVLRYRLYEIDRLVSRTLSYAILTALLAGVFVGLVALTTNTLALSGRVGVAASTLVAAALFNPLRLRIQRLVDRRFNRARYDAEATVAAFTSRLRDAVEIDAIRADLLDAVNRAVEPTHASVWIKP